MEQNRFNASESFALDSRTTLQWTIGTPQMTVAFSPRRITKTRKRMVDAFDLFAERGYRGMTMAPSTLRARIAETITHFTIHSKAKLLA